MSSMSDSGTGGRGGAELMVEQFHLKVLHAVLAVRGRALQPAASASFRRQDRWFHLRSTIRSLRPRRRSGNAGGRGAARGGHPPGSRRSRRRAAARSGGGGGGRWTVVCEPWPDAAAGEGIPVNRAYKRCMTMLRSVYATLRFLPAYRVFRLLCANQSYNYEMVHRVGSFAVPLSRDEEAAMRSYQFVPVETQHGRLVVSVQYLPSLAAFNLEISSLSPSMLIADYVGSPAAEPMRAFPASLTGATGSAFPQALSNQPQRPHSWATPALWPQAPRQQARFSPPHLLNASPTPSPPNFPSGYLQSRPKGGSAPMSIPQVGDRRSPIHRPITLPPTSPRRVGETGTSSAQQSPSERCPSFGRADGFRIMDPYASLSPGRKVIHGFKASNMLSTYI